MCSTAPTGLTRTPVLDPEWQQARAGRWLNGTGNPSHEHRLKEHEGRKEPSRSPSGINTLLSLNKTCLSCFQDVHPLLECLQGQGAHYPVRQLLTQTRGACFHDFRLPMGPHRGNLLCFKTNSQSLTFPPLREKTGLGLKHHAEEFRPHVGCKPFPVSVVPEAGIAGLAIALDSSSLQ